MPPIYVKGGIWTNVEDEILRAAISKYGLNQWARVSSLLARKTAKQAKARWMEWLNPSIKKIEWSREEDEKLLHLAKLMPTQWRTIAPIVGRTATQCIERYQKLLEDAEQEEIQSSISTDLSLTGVGAEASAPVGNQRRGRIGDIDPTPESKPARPDAIDMDDDEKEMLSEARARLANTQGKKAKRKDRERLLEESRRLATLQKRRELKLAGINTKIKKRNRNQVDYNADIPFEHKPAPGFYDTTEEEGMNYKSKRDFERKTNKKGVLMKESIDKEKSSKKKYHDKATALAAAEQAAKAHAEQLYQLNQADQLAKRRKLVLPTPQVQDEEIEQIVKFGSRGEKMQKLYEGQGSVTQNLMGEYNEELLGSMRTPQIAQSDDRLMQSVREIKAMADQTSLLGDSDASGAPRPRPNFSNLPSSSTLRTPNPLAMRTPGPGGLPSQTPRRDALGFNNNEFGSSDPRSLIRHRFKSLPKPANNFEILLPEETKIDERSYLGNDDLVIDEGESEAKRIKELEEEKRKELLARSQVLQKELPRPVPSNVAHISEISSNKKATAQYNIAANEIIQELKQLIISDSIRYPSEYAEEISDKSSTTVPILEKSQTDAAFDEIKTEAEKNEKFQHNIAAFAQTLDRPFSLPGHEGSRNDKNKFNSTKKILSTDLVEVATKSNQIEEKLKKTMGGYSKRQDILSSKLIQSFEALSNLRIERAKESAILQMETIALGSRLSALQEEVDYLADTERNGQALYQQYQTIVS